MLVCSDSAYDVSTTQNQNIVNNENMTESVYRTLGAMLPNKLHYRKCHYELQNKFSLPK